MLALSLLLVVSLLASPAEAFGKAKVAVAPEPEGLGTKIKGLFGGGVDNVGNFFGGIKDGVCDGTSTFMNRVQGKTDEAAKGAKKVVKSKK